MQSGWIGWAAFAPESGAAVLGPYHTPEALADAVEASHMQGWLVLRPLTVRETLSLVWGDMAPVTLHTIDGRRAA